MTYDVKIINAPVSDTVGLLIYLFETNMQISLRRGALHHLEYCQNTGFQWKPYSDVIFAPGSDTLRYYYYRPSKSYVI